MNEGEAEIPWMKNNQEIDTLAKDAQGKAAYEYWIRNVLKATWITVSWEELTSEKQVWVDLVTAGDDAYLAEYRRLLEENDDQP